MKSSLNSDSNFAAQNINSAKILAELRANSLRFDHFVAECEPSGKLQLGTLTCDDDGAPLEGAERTATFSADFFDNGEALGVLMKTNKSSAEHPAVSELLGSIYIGHKIFLIWLIDSVEADSTYELTMYASWGL